MTTSCFAAALLTIGLLTATTAFAEVIGTADTAFKLIGPDHKIKIEAFDDEEITGASSVGPLGAFPGNPHLV